LNFNTVKKYLSTILISKTLSLSAFSAITPLPYVVPAVVDDRQEAQVPDRVRLSGMLGARIEANTYTRLLETVDVDRLLEGYRKRPGRQTWDGEHIGKWIHAASLAWANSGDAKLRAKIVGAVAELVKCQEADGYLGTYLPAKRWTDWDVWAHKYNLIGLLTWIRLSGDRSSLDCCLRMGDLLCREFGESKRDLNTSGQHSGMASGSVLEPMVLLYRFTGDQRYRDFCQYILRDWETATGPHLVATLLTAKHVDEVGNAKAYEMLSCLNGLLEWYRATGDKELLTAALNAWEDITAKRLYITGAASWGERFHDDYDLPNTGAVGETCVTVTWEQFNLQLLRLTGQARYAQELERIAYNQLSGAQRPDGRAWGYYVTMKGVKPYSSSLDGHCCLSSGPRGVALISTAAMTTDGDGVVVNLHEAGRADLRLRDGSRVAMAIATTYPSDSKVTITIQPEKTATFCVKLRIPTWCPTATLKFGSQTLSTAAGKDGYAVIRRTWQPGDQLSLDLPLTPRVVVGDHLNHGKASIHYGPLVLASDAALDPAGRKQITLSSTDVASLNITPEPAQGNYHDWAWAQVFRMNTADGSTLLAPFTTAGVGLKNLDNANTVVGPKTAYQWSFYQVWLPVAGMPDGEVNLLAGGVESRSRPGSLSGSILAGKLVDTKDGTQQDQDWYAVTLANPVALQRVVFTQGRYFDDGGWFDTTSGKPQVQIQTIKDGSWITVGELAHYPKMRSPDPTIKNSWHPRYWNGARFTCTLIKPVTALALRVIGKPASGNDPKQSFSSCAGLAVYER